MRILLLSFIFLVFSCGYPDVDSMPNFNKINLTKSEAIDLCQLNNIDSYNLEKCLKSVEVNY